MSTWTLKEKSTGDLEVTIEGEEWTKACEKAFNKIAKNVTIDGFRKGSAPKALIEKRVSAQEKYLTAIDDNANEWMRKALEENNLEPISQPQLDVKAMDDTKADLVFTFAVTPEVKLGTYKGLKYEIEDTTVSDEDVENEIKRMQSNYAELETTEDAAVEGDTVNINYEGFKDDVAFDGGKADNYDLKLGSGSFIPGFEDQLIGTKAGDEKDVNLSFPEDYYAKDLAGAPVVFKVKVNEVKKEVLPELDDDFAKDLNIPDVEDMESLKKTIRTRLEDQKKASAESKADSELMKQLTDAVECDMPDALVDQEIQNEINQLQQNLQQYGMGLSQYLSMMGKKPEDLKEEYRENATNSVKLRLGLEAIAKAEGLEATDEDVEKEYDEIAKQYNMEASQVKALINSDMLKKDICNQKAYDFVKENAAK